MTRPQHVVGIVNITTVFTIVVGSEAEIGALSCPDQARVVMIGVRGRHWSDARWKSNGDGFQSVRETERRDDRCWRGRGLR